MNSLSFIPENAQLSHVVTTLFDIFLPNSNGNLNHFGKIFETLLRRHPGPVLDMMVIERRATRLIDQMLPYICESPVQVAMLALLFFPTVQHDMKIKRQECYSRLQEMGFLEKVLGFLELKGNTELFFLALVFYFFFFCYC